MFGARVKRLEDPRLLAGRGHYLDDMTVPGMLHLAVLRSVHAHAEIESVDPSEALALPGVVDAFTFEALGDSPPTLPVLLRNEWQQPCPQYPLAPGRVRHVGEAIAVVVADSRYVAEDALERIDVRYRPLPAVTDYDTALAESAPLLHDTAPGNVCGTWSRRKGDIDRAFAEADVVVKTRIESQRYSGVPLEGRGVLACTDQLTGELIVWDSTQMPHTVRAFLCGMLGLPESRLRVAVPDVGGGFGVKLDLYPEDFLVPFASLRLGRPVKWVEDRQEHLLSASHARQQAHEFELALTSSGKILGLRDRMFSDLGAYVRTLGITNTDLSSATVPGPYRVPAVDIQVKAVVTNKSPSNPYRGAGQPESTYVRERLMDIAARQLGMDPAEFRSVNLVGPQEMPYRTGVSSIDGEVVFDSGDFPAALDRALEISGYRDIRAAQAAGRADGKRTGVGIAVYSQVSGPGPFEGATVEVDGDGIVTISSGAVPIGQGTLTTMAQIVSEQLGVPLESVRGRFADTAAIPFGVGTFASRATVMAGNACHSAAVQVKDMLAQLAAQALEAGKDDLVFENGSVSVRGDADASLTIAELARLAGPMQRRPAGMGPGVAATAYNEGHNPPYSYAVHVAVVELDTDTGRPAVTAYYVVNDAGRIVNPMMVEGQIIGGVAQGLGGALLEELAYDSSGQMTAASLSEYLLPTAADVPRVSITHVQTPSPLNELGVKGLGEGGAIGAHAAVANAVADALGDTSRATATPFTPQRMWHLLRAPAQS